MGTADFENRGRGEASESLGDRVVRECLANGFAMAGVCEARPSEYGAELDAWLLAGKAGSMGYLAQHAEIRKDPALFVTGVRSLIMVADQYAVRGDRDDVVDASHGRVARYARGRDYHIEMKDRLHAVADRLRGEFPGHEFRAFVDTAPVLEREHAVRAGLGWIGKHTLVINPKLGSWFLLGGIATTLEIPVQGGHEVVTDHCGSCTRCIDACPTGAISERSVDATRCISYLTIEHRGDVPQELAAKLDDWVFGCDVCQEVCPHNSQRGAGMDVGHANEAYAPRVKTLGLLDVLGWRSEDRSRVLSGSAMKRARLSMLKRNAMLVMTQAVVEGRVGAAEREALKKRLMEIAGDVGEEEMVRDEAGRCLERMG
jgi:epoxyqueuosine reductase